MGHCRSSTRIRGHLVQNIVFRVVVLAGTSPGHFLRVTVDGGTLSQNGQALVWDGHGYYEVALDAGTLTWAP